MIEIYKTNISKKKDAKKMVNQLKQFFPKYRFDFDLEDCDRILRIETFDGTLDHNTILKLVGDNGFSIEVLPDNFP